jgi:hypothetical protein
MCVRVFQGYNHLIVFSRPFYFCLCCGLVLLMDAASRYVTGTPVYVYGMPFTVSTSLTFARDLLKGQSRRVSSVYVCVCVCVLCLVFPTVRIATSSGGITRNCLKTVFLFPTDYQILWQIYYIPDYSNRHLHPHRENGLSYYM